jgi:hypothetical protein
MFLGFTSAAELRVSDRDKVVNEIDWTDSGGFYPSAVTLIMEPSVTHVEIQPTGAAATSAQAVAQGSTYQPAMKRVLPSGQDLEQRFGGESIEDAPDSAILNDGLSLTREMLQIGNANAIDPRRSAPVPPAPYQASNIE